MFQKKIQVKHKTYISNISINFPLFNYLTDRKLTKNLIDTKLPELIKIFKKFKVMGNGNQNHQDRLQERLKHKIDQLESK